MQSISSVRLILSNSEKQVLGGVDKHSASTIPVYFGGCAALIHPTKKLRFQISVMILMIPNIESTYNVLSLIFKPYNLFQGFSPILTGHY